MEGQIELEDYLRSLNCEGFDICDYIPKGRASAVTRYELCMKTGFRDRQVRDLIHYARRDGSILNKKVEKSSEKSADKAVKIEEEKTEKLKKQSDKVVKNHEKAADDVADAWKDAGKDTEKALSKLDDDIEITVDADADTGKAEQKIEHVSKDKNIDVDVNADVSDAGSGIESLEDVAEKTGEKISEKLSESASVAGNLGGALKESLGAAAESSLPLVGNIGKLTEGLSGAKVAALGVGVAAAGVVVAGVKGANDIRSLGSVSVPDWVPGVGGKSFSLPKMSRLKIGMDYVPCDMYPAYLDEGEWVLTKEEANILRSYGGLEGMIGMIDRNSSNVSVNVQNQNREFDYEKFGRAAADAMITAGIGFKCDEREFARLIKDLIDYV